LTTPPSGYKPGDHHPDPFANDTPLYTVNAQNLDRHAQRLTAGQIALIKTYPGYSLPVYPTRRSAAFPQRIYDATAKVAITARVANEGANVEYALVGIPFPIPSTGIEVIWNHLLRYRGDAATRSIGQAAPQRGGSYSLVQFEDEFFFNYTRPNVTAADLDNVLLFFKQAVTAPARLAGSILLVHETLDQVRETRRAPNVAYDAPGTAADGMRTSDQFDMFNGAPDRYQWQLIGKREVIVPYNSYKLHSRSVKYSDILKPLHINQDSWQILAVDQYDSREQLWRVSEAHCIEYYEVPLFWSTLEVHTDLQAGRYLAIGLDNEGKMYDFSIKRSAADYVPDSLRREGVR